MDNILTRLILMIIFSLSFGQVSARRHSKELPKITLERYIEEDAYSVVTASKEFPDLEAESFENDFVIKNKSDYIVSQSARQIGFLCSAPYPIQWKIPYPEQFSFLTEYDITILSKRSSSFTNKQDFPSNLQFNSTLYIQNRKSTIHYQTGYLLCESVDFPKELKTQIYLWSQGNTVMDRMEGVTNVTVPKSASQLIIPCRPVVPNAIISLYEQQLFYRIQLHASSVFTRNRSSNITHQPRYKSRWVPVPTGKNNKFDPKVGFRLTPRGLSPISSIVGLYRCHGSWNEQEYEDWKLDNQSSSSNSSYKLFNVTIGDPTPIAKFEPRSNTKTRTARIVMDTNLLQIHCCSGNNKKPPRVNRFTCQNEAECEFLQDVFANSIDNDPFSHSRMPVYPSSNAECAQTWLSSSYRAGTLYSCRAENIDVLTRYLTLPNPTQTQQPQYTNHYYRHYSIRKIAIHNISEDIGINIKMQLNISPTNFRGHRSFSRYGGNRNYYYHYGYNPYLTMPQTIYEGMEVSIDCTAHNFFYAYGGWLQLNWRNGSKTIFPVSNQSSIYTYGYNDESYGDLIMMPAYYGGINGVNGLVKRVSLEMDSVACFIPPWNSLHWDKLTQPFNVTPTELPMFSNSSDKSILTIELNKNETKTINCSLVISNQTYETLLYLKWAKDGKNLSLYDGLYTKQFKIRTQITATQIYTTITFLEATHEIHGKYYCIAKNLKGQVEKEYTVIVNAKKNHLEAYLLGGFITSLVIFSVTIVMMIWKHRKLQLKISRNMASLKYINNS